MLLLQSYSEKVFVILSEDQGQNFIAERAYTLSEYTKGSLYNPLTSKSFITETYLHNLILLNDFVNNYKITADKQCHYPQISTS